MSLNNINVYEKPVTSLAAMCLTRLSAGELDMEIKVRNKSKRTREWVDLKNNPLNDGEMQKLTELSHSALLGLWRRYQGDCTKIINNHGLALKKRGGRSGTRYRDRFGTYVGQRVLMKKYGLTQTKIGDIYHSVEFDYVAAFKIIDGLDK